MYIDIYRAVSGWKAVCLGSQGPEYTSFIAFATPEEAYEESKQMALDEEVPFALHTFGTCAVHGKQVVDGVCDVCLSAERKIRLEEMISWREHDRLNGVVGPYEIAKQEALLWEAHDARN